MRMVRRGAGVVAGILLACCACASALDPSLDISQYAHTAWKVRDGFTKGALLSVVQTPDGYLWLGTEFSLYRFDGARAVPWQPPNGEQLPSKYVLNLLVSRDGTLWIGTAKGLASYKDGKLTRYPEPAGRVAILSMIEDRVGKVWISTSEITNGRVCGIQDGKAECYGAGSFGHGVSGVYEDETGNLWAAAATGLWRWTPTPQNYPFPRGVTEANSIIEGDDRALLLATNDGVKKFAGGKIQDYQLPGIPEPFRPKVFFRSSDGSLWIGAHQGLVHLHQGRIDRFTVTEGLSGQDVLRIFEDREGSIWVATLGGLDRFRDYAVPTISGSQGISSSGVWSVQAISDGSIWLGSTGGLHRWERGHVSIYRARSASGRGGGERQLTIGAGATEIANSGLSGIPMSLGRDDAGRLWVSTGDGMFQLEGDRFLRVPDVPAGNIFSIAGDGRGGVWILNGNGGLFHRTSDGAVQHVPWSQFEQKGPSTLALDPVRGGLWLGFVDGGIAYFKDGQVSASYSAAQGLGNGRVNQFRFGPRGALLAATEGGLSRIKDGQVATLTSKNGLPCDTVHWSMDDDDHALWLYMPCGLVRVERSDLDAWVSDPKHVVKTTVWDSSDGARITGTMFGFGPHVTKSPDGRVWFANFDGVSVIDPRHLAFNKLPPPVHIEQITADRQTYNVTSDANEKVHLPPLIREVEIDYTALSLIAPEKVLFRYKLEGFDREWQDAGTRRQAFYSNLPPGNYSFRVKACNNSGVWNEAGALLGFNIAPAYYQTRWFLALCIAGALAGLYLLHLWGERQVAEQVRVRMEERLAERERIARDLHDTLLQSVQGLILKFSGLVKRIPREDPVRQEMDRALDRADEVLSEGRDRVRSLRSSAASSSELPAAFQRVAEETAPSRTATFKTVVEGVARELHPVVLEESFCIGREALVNAFSHSGGDHVEVEITYDSRQFRLRVRDDGRGVDPAVLASGARSDHWGLPGMRERARKIGGRLELWSRPGSGTEVELSVPAATAYQDLGAKSKKGWFRRSSATIGE